MPLWLSSLLIVVPSVLSALIGHLFVRKTVGIDKLILNNEVAGFKYATLGVIYAVLLGFVVIVVWEEFNNAENSVDHEASALITLYRYESALPETAPGQLRNKLLQYAEIVVHDEWQTMARGEISPLASQALADLFSEYKSMKIQGEPEISIYNASLTLLSHVSEHRRDRLDAADGTIPGIMYFALSIGAIVLISFTYFFGAKSVWAQMTMTALLSLMVALVILLILVLDHPFTGDAAVSTKSFLHAIEVMRNPP